MELTPEQEALRSTVQALLEKRSDSAAVRAALGSPSGYDLDLWERLVELGAAAMVVPEEYDGVGATLVEAGLVLEQLGHSLAPSPLLESLVATSALAAVGGDVAADLLPRLAAGELVTLHRTGPHSPPNGAFPATESGVSCVDGRLTGTTLLPYADRAAALLIATESEAGPMVCQVDPADVRAEHAPTLDQTLHLATVTLDEAPARVIAEGVSATAAVEAARQAELVGIAALATGAAQRALDMTVGYAKERTQFGRPIGSFQALKHRMADMLVLVETSRSASWAAARGLMDAGDAAIYCTDALSDIAAETIQLHGGIAITWEHDAHLIFKRAHALRQLVRQPSER
ncbi:acyl-CoA dehydrogenase family protein [Nocardioides sp. Kera G14]|uniref:acyl-CoA dehydrogenase family protein n=1 Tax=Nocardioides sp. Kera G14 TaxID=2884264 RepID=UPI001D122683|nr:acyl-CoA dehydrogenase family protein [Nocardioides sp. Kera G14]UDY25382.1 acyl-CoA/acyl-ACP dehydrogenase [Nocardioides sp. Kera G14]